MTFLFSLLLAVVWNSGGSPRQEFVVREPLPDSLVLVRRLPVAPPFAGFRLGPLRIEERLFLVPIRGSRLYAVQLASLGDVRETPLQDARLVLQTTFCAIGRRIFVPSGFTGKVFGIEEGAVLWAFSTGGAETTGITCEEEGLYFSSQKGTLFALRDDGSVRWTAPAEPVSWISAVLRIQGGQVLVRDAFGVLRRFAREDGRPMEPIRAPEGSRITAEFVDEQERLWWVEEGEGTRIRREDLEVPFATLEEKDILQLAVSKRYVWLLGEKALVLFNMEGEVLRRFPTEHRFRGMLVFEDGVILQEDRPEGRGALVILGIYENREPKRFPGEGRFMATPVFSGRYLLAPNEDGRLYVLEAVGG